MRRYVFVLTLATASGCASYALERHSLNQIASVSDLRYKEVMNNLALLGANPAALPSFAVTADGLVQIIDVGTFDSKTLWGHTFRGFISDTLSGTASRSPQHQWTLDPVADEPKIKALWYALLWALHGQPPECSEAAEVLKKFQVDRELAKLPPNWLHIGGCKDVPRCSCYQAHCRGYYVWVDPDGMAGLSLLTLVLLDIATVDLPSLEPPLPTAAVTHERSSTFDKSKVTWDFTLDARQRPDGSIEVGNFYGEFCGRDELYPDPAHPFRIVEEELHIPGPDRRGWGKAMELFPMEAAPMEAFPREAHLHAPRAAPLPFSPRAPIRGYTPAPRTTSSSQLESIINATRGGR